MIELCSGLSQRLFNIPPDWTIEDYEIRGDIIYISEAGEAVKIPGKDSIIMRFDYIGLRRNIRKKYKDLLNFNKVAWRIGLPYVNLDDITRDEFYREQEKRIVGAIRDVMKMRVNEGLVLFENIPFWYPEMTEIETEKYGDSGSS